ncbi:N-acetylmuramoyl-L-alanine amidase [Buchnera aphidicola]|uniref:N-acetylmuramoyl-L-alanine amidase family protein n=1 Tax=Buchnera aphidicola TaxID=9 RepID=UPI0021C94590|nr:N-acetylmuramoyl-L-alanine amidase [Buchnera aphidicola]
MGHSGLQEKKVTLNIALKIKKLFEKEKRFQIILTRKNDCNLSVQKRKQYFKKHYANLLVSIHVNSSKKAYVSGASTWIISNNRMNREINNYLKNNKEIIFFEKKIQKILNKNILNIGLKKSILNFQFNNFQKMEIDLSDCILKELKKNTKLYKKNPNYANFGILSSINMPSLLIEIGFITNFKEEQKLKTQNYQNHIAYSIYHALKKFFYSKKNKKNN